MSSRAPQIVVVPAGDFVAMASDNIAQAIAAVLARRPRCRLALAGGSTPRPVYEALAGRDDIAWSRVDIFFGDERAVGPDNPASNYRMVATALLDAIEDVASVARIEGERPPEEAAQHYAKALGSQALDIVLLGMGGDGHTASLFPDDAASARTDTDVVVTCSPVPPTTRISLSRRALNAAQLAIVLVVGPGKAERVAQVYKEVASATPHLPLSHIAPDPGRLVWLLDAEAARKLEQPNEPNLL